ncbi:MAG: hydantoinase/oxoprolinase family protein [Thermoprotei archaeon]
MLTIAIDIGGTFTDIIAVDDQGLIHYYKGSTTPKNPEIGVYEGLKRFADIKEVIHATTIATNALLGQIGLELPKTALFITKGFRDIIEIGRQNRPELYNLFFEKPRPLVPRELRFEVSERVNANGEILIPLDTNEVEEKMKKALESGVVSVGISFLHSYLNPLNEVKAKEVAVKYFKYVSVSHEVAPEPREYERTSTVVVNAVLMPLVSKYLESLYSIFSRFGNPPFYIMASSGGLIDVREASEKPVQIIESGPAAGVVGASIFMRFLGIKDAISFDMGGTTAKAGTIVNQEIEVATEYEVGGKTHHGRIIKGSGYPIRFPFIDLAEVSAGGGTIIWRDEGGALRIGPISAGADPGPMCYGKGGDKPTLTDANLILGRIGDELLSGSMKLNKDLATKGLEKLGGSKEIAVEAVDLANLEMARAIRLVTVERGLDPSGFVLFAFGGAGPQHALDLAEELGIRRVIVPPHPGLFSALGMLFADKKIEMRKSYPRDLNKDFNELENNLREKIGDVDYFLRYADIRYEGQGWELTVPLSTNITLDEIKKRFEGKHESVYGFKLDKPIEIVTIRVFAIAKILKPKLPDPPLIGNPKIRFNRKVYFDDWIDTPVYVRESLPMGYKIKGPAVIEEYSSTILIKPGWIAEVGKMGVLDIRR